MNGQTTFDAKHKIWSGKKMHPIFYPNLSLGDAILWKLQHNPNNVAQVSADSGIELTNHNLYIKTVRAAQNLQKLGYQKNDVFSLIAKNSHHVAPILFAACCLACPVSTAFDENQLKVMFQITKPKVVFCDVSVCDLISNVLDELKNDAKIYTFGGVCNSSRAVEELFEETHNESEFVATEIDGENDVAVIVCSSGTTGLSKCVCVSHHVLVGIMAASPGFNPSSVIFSFSSLYWFSGVSTLLLGTLCGVKRVITTEPFSPELLLNIIEKYKVTVVGTTLYQVLLILRCEQIATTDLSSVQIFACGGSRMLFATCNELKKYLPNGIILVPYSLTEIGNLVSRAFLPYGGDNIGQLAHGIQVKIIDDNGEKLGIGQHGEICVKTQHKILGYYGNEEATKKLFDDEGFILTGDIGYFDEKGYLHFVDRKRDLLKFRDYVISPSEIENYLVETSRVKAVCVVGQFDIFGDEAHQVPAAAVVKNENSDIKEEEIEQLVRDHFADYKCLRGGVYFVDALPYTPSGKVIRRKVREIVEQLSKLKLK